MNFLKGIFSTKPLVSKLITIFVVMIFCISVGSAISILLSQGIANEIIMLKTSQVVLAIFSFIIPAFFCAYFFDKNTTQFLSLSPHACGSFYFLSAAIIIFAIPSINFMAEWNSKLTLPECFAGIEQWMQQQETKNTALTERFLSTSSWIGLLANLFVMAILPAFSEELFFRGLLQKTFTQRFGIHVGIWLSAILFSAVHLQFYGFFPRMFLGAMFGYFVYWSGSIFPAIAAHFINNAIVVLIAFFSENNTETLSQFGTNKQWFFALTSFVICSFLLWIFYRNRYQSK